MIKTASVVSGVTTSKHHTTTCQTQDDFQTLFDRESCTFTYILGDQETKEAVIIDPVDTLVERDVEVLEKLGLSLKYAVNTHIHADHITGSGLLKKRFSTCKSVLGLEGNKEAKADLKLKEGEQIKVGSVVLDILSTPGHTNGCHTFVATINGRKAAFVGDLILAGGCGRTDFQQGSSDKMYASVHEKVFTMGDDTTIYSAHDYKGILQTSVSEERRFNRRLTKPLEEFKKIMANLNLSNPKMIDIAVPRNMLCGLQEDP